MVVTNEVIAIEPANQSAHLITLHEICNDSDSVLNFIFPNGP